MTPGDRPDPALAIGRAFVEAATVSERIGALDRFVRATRGPDNPSWKSGVVPHLLAVVEEPGLARERFGEAIAGLFGETDATDLIATAGIPGHRGFLAEFGDRLSARLVPAPRDEADLQELVRRLYGSAEAVEHLGGMPLDLFHRVVTVFQTATPPGSFEPLSGAFADGFRLLLTRIESEGLSPKLRARGSGGPVSQSPFHRIRAVGEALLAGWRAGSDVSDAASAFRKVSGECRKEARLVEQHLEGAGVSVDIVFSLQVIERCLTRTALMTEILEAPAGPRRSRGIHRLLVRLLRSAHEDRSLRHLVAWNLQLLNRKIVDRAGETGEHYIANNRREYRHIWAAAAGGGALTVATAIVKTTIHTWHLPALPEGLLYGLNYAVSFVALQHLGLILATKQPAMTAARFARIIGQTEGEDRERRIAATAARLTSSQLAAVVANVLVVATGAVLFSRLFLALAGRPFLAPDEAVDTLRVMSPVDSWTTWYAGLTGVILWLASVAGGWFDNWCVYHRIPEGIARHPLGERFGRARVERFGRAVARHASGWGTNISLGFMLGLAPAIGRFTGLPVDVRHVTLNSGIVALAASGVDVEGSGLAWLLRALSGVGVMFVLNLSVSFGLSLLSATRAYSLDAEDVKGILGGIGRRLVKMPLAFVRPPAADAADDGEPSGAPV